MVADYYSQTLESSSLDFSVTIEDHGEHHMGCSTIYIQPSRPLGGVSRLHSTNGNALFTPDGRSLIIHDACVIVFVDLQTDEIFNLEPPKGWYFTHVRIEDDSLKSDLYNAGGKRNRLAPIPLVKVRTRFQPGFGRVVSGRFPSAYP
jgi:hypothetical protein